MMRISKRNFIKSLTFGLGASALGLLSFKVFNTKNSTDQSINNLNQGANMPFELPKLPYARNALEPYISEKTLDFHYGKHHNAYVTNLNNLVNGTDLSNKSLEEIIKITAEDPNKVGIFNNAAQVWNHTFYWHSMTANGGGNPKGLIADKIKEDFGSYENFAEQFKNAGATQFGSGWAWLVLENGKLKVTKTLNANTPLTSGATPILTMDVWEHAYYLDFQNARPNYINTFLNNLVNWDFANQNLKKAL